MKNIIILLTFLCAITSYAVAPYGIKGQQQTSTLYSNVHKFPNNQVTNLGGINALVETGNTNILSNPSFEHSTFSTSWTNSAGTFTQETSVLISGKASAKEVLAAQTMSLSQSSTLYAAQFADGVQGLAMVRIKSDIALSVCSIQAGTVSTTNCVTTATDNKWGLYKIPFILGATSNGISIASAGSVTGTVYIDDAFVGAVDLKQDINNVGPWRTYTPTFTGFGTVTNNSFFWRQIGDGIEINGTVTTGIVAASLASITLPNSYTLNTTKISLSNTTSSAGVGIGEWQQNGSANGFSSIVTATGTSTSLLYFGSSIASAISLVPANGLTMANSTQVLSVRIKVPVTQLSGSSSVYTASCGANCVDTFSALVTDGAATTTVSQENAEFITGNCTNASAGTYVCTIAGFTVAPNCVASPLAGREFQVSSTSTTVFVNTSNSAGVATDGSFTLVCQKQGADFVATRTIQGSFNEVVTTQGVSKPQLYSAYITSTGTITSEFGDFISGNCAVSGTSIYTCTLNTGKFATAPVCVVAALVSGHLNYGSMQSTTTSAVIYRTNNYTGIAQARDAMLICHGDL